MIIVSKHNEKVSIKFSGEKVSFNEKREAKVSKELGEKILKNFPGDYWEEGSKPTAPKKDDDTPIDDVQVQKLKDEVFRLQGIVDTKNKAIQAAKEGEKSWREAFEKLQNEMNGKGTDKAPTPEPKKEDEEEKFVIPEKHKDLFEAMNKKNFNALKKWIKESFDKEEEDLKDCVGKEGLMKFVIEKCDIEN